MEKEYADLHIHTNESDSTFSPEEVVRYASQCNLKAIAITDHDSVAAIIPAKRCAAEYGIEIIPGVELTAYINDFEIHILAYYLNYGEKWFLNKLDLLKKARLVRAQQIVRKLNKAGIGIDISDVTALSGNGAVGRMHIARVLVEKKRVPAIPDAFRRYIGKGRIAYVQKWTFSPGEIIDLISAVGGVSVLAHPNIMGQDKIISTLAKKGLQGLEVYHSNHSPQEVKKYISLAREYGLLVTGGSDCHGMGKGGVLMGTVKIPYRIVEELKKKAAGNRQREKCNDTGGEDGG